MNNTDKEFRTVVFRETTASEIYPNNFLEGDLRFIRVDLCNIDNLFDKIDMKKALRQIAGKFSYIDKCFDVFVNHVLQLYGLPSANKVIHYPYSAVFIAQADNQLYKSLLAFQEEFNLNLIKQGSPLHVRMGSVLVSTQSRDLGFDDMCKVLDALQEKIDNDCPYRSFINEDKTWKIKEFEDVEVNDVTVVTNMDKNYHDVLSKFNIVAYALIDFDKTRNLLVQWADHIGTTTPKIESVHYSISNMSMQFNRIYSFFKDSAGYTCENIAPLFVTGHSLLVVGDWKEVFDWITKTKIGFDKYFKDTEITVSAAVTVCKNSTPFMFVYSNLRDQLKITKNKGGDSVSVWGTVNIWRSFEDGLKFGKKLYSLYEGRFISKVMLYKLYEHCERGVHGNSELIPVLLAQLSKQYRFSGPKQIEKLEELCGDIRKAVSYDNYNQLMLSVSYALTALKERNGN